MSISPRLIPICGLAASLFLSPAVPSYAGQGPGAARAELALAFDDPVDGCIESFTVTGTVQGTIVLDSTPLPGTYAVEGIRSPGLDYCASPYGDWLQFDFHLTGTDDLAGHAVACYATGLLVRWPRDFGPVNGSCTVDGSEPVDFGGRLEGALIERPATDLEFHGVFLQAVTP